MYIEILYGRASCRGPPPPANEQKEGSGRYQQRRTYKAPLRELGGEGGRRVGWAGWSYRSPRNSIGSGKR